MDEPWCLLDPVESLSPLISQAESDYRQRTEQLNPFSIIMPLHHAPELHTNWVTSEPKSLYHRDQYVERPDPA